MHGARALMEGLLHESARTALPDALHDACAVYGHDRLHTAQLAQLGGQVLFFDGEATHVRRPGTVHGAVESSWRAAAEIMTQG